MLWSSKSLDLLHVDDPQLCSPSLFTTAANFVDGALPSPAGATPPKRDARAVSRWFWRVDPTFAAWVLRLVRKAESSGVEVSSRELDSWRVIQAAMRELGKWPEVEQLAADKVVLPGGELIAHAADLAYRGDVPMFDGIEKVRGPLADDEVSGVALPVRRERVAKPSRREKPDNNGLFD